MINLFENYREQEQDLEHSLIKSGYRHPTVVLNDDGYLPPHLLSPIGFFTGAQKLNESPKERNPKFFNEVEIPEYWEIRGDARQAEIFEGYKKKGQIHYSNCEGDYRAVKSVEWWNDQGRVRAIDLYNQYGQLFGRQTYSDGDLTLTTYFNLEFQEVILFNHVAQTIQVDYQGKRYIFKSFDEFVLFYLEVSDLNVGKIFYNSLSRPFFITTALQRKDPQTSYAHVLFWQEESKEIPGNMSAIIKDPASPTKKIVIQDREEYIRIKQQLPEEYESDISYLGFLYPILEKKNIDHSILVATHSDQIPQLKLLVEQLPDYHFSIAAQTSMSNKLLAFEKYNNVRLYPVVDNQTLQNLFLKSSIYLDINYGREVGSSIRRAFENGQLIFGFNETLHNARYVSKENRFNVKEVPNMISTIISATKNKRVFQKALGSQLWEGGQSTIEEYEEVLK